VAFFADHFALAVTFIAVLLELLHEAWRYLLLLNCEALAFAGRALLHVFRRVGAGTPTVRTNYLPVVGHVHFCAHIQLLES
jgi:hypothetical protein